MSEDVTLQDVQEKLLPKIQEHKKRGAVMTIAETLRQEGRKKGQIEGRKEGQIEGEIQTWREILNSPSLPPEIARQAHQKIDELTKKLEQILSQFSKSSARASRQKDR